MISNSHDFYVLNSLSIAIQFTDSRHYMAARTATATVDQKANDLVKPTAVTEPDQTSSGEITPWGTDNLHPEKIRDLIRKNSKLKVGLAMSAQDLLGLGIQTGILVEDEEGEEHFKPKSDPAYREWARAADPIGNYAILASRNLRTHYVAFVSVTLSADRKRISLMKTIPAWQCRLDKAGADGYHKFCYVSSFWKEGATPSDTEKVKKLPLIDTWYDPARLLRNQIAQIPDSEFILYCRIPTDEIDYSLPDWYSIVEQQWLDVSNDVPIFKKWVMKNITTLNQIMYISDEYFRMKYPEWERWKQDAARGDEEAAKKLKEAYESVVETIQKRLSGKENVGKLITAPLLEKHLGTDLAKSIIIEKVDQNVFDGKFNADAQEADTQILFALNVDPNKSGAQPGSTGEFGSAKRQSHNLSQVSQFIFEHVLLAPLRLVRDFNGLNKDLEFRVRRTTLPTLDKVSPAKRDPQATL